METREPRELRWRGGRVLPTWSEIFGHLLPWPGPRPGLGISQASGLPKAEELCKGNGDHFIDFLCCQKFKGNRDKLKELLSKRNKNLKQDFNSHTYAQ